MLLGINAIIVLFTAIIALMKTNGDFSGILAFLTIVIGYVFVVMTYLKRKKLKEAKKVIYQGFEQLLYYISQLFLAICCLLMYCDSGNLITMTSPLIIVGWLEPLISYLYYDHVLVFFAKYLRLREETIYYKNIKYVEVIDYKKNKKKMIIKAKSKNYVYSAKEELIDEAKQYILEKNKRVVVK